MVLQELDKTINQIREAGTDIHFLSTILRGIAYKDRNFSAIVVNDNLSYEETRDVLIHENCHLVSNSLYRYRSPQKQKEFCETRASNMAIREIIPLKELMDYLDMYPNQTPEDIAKKFSTTIKTVQKAFELYTDDEIYINWWENYKMRYEL